MSSLCGNHARNKRIPALLIKSPHLLGLLLRSLFEGDGSLVHRSRSLSTTSPSLAYQVRSICAANNILVNVSYNEDRDVYNCVIYPGHIDRWNKFTSEEIELPHINRKSAQHFIETDDYFFVPIRSISEQSEKLDVYDICVDESHSFTGNGVLLHNTITESMAAGTPVVVPDNTCMPQQIGSDGDRGYMYPCNDQLWIDPSGFRKKGLVPDIVAAMMRAYNGGPKQENEVVKRAREWSETHDWKLVANKWVDLFNEEEEAQISISGSIDSEEL
jgi:hypothetical protein